MQREKTPFRWKKNAFHIQQSNAQREKTPFTFNKVTCSVKKHLSDSKK
jgi:hypothetical protein